MSPASRSQRDHISGGARCPDSTKTRSDASQLTCGSVENEEPTRERASERAAVAAVRLCSSSSLRPSLPPSCSRSSPLLLSTVQCRSESNDTTASLRCRCTLTHTMDDLATRDPAALSRGMKRKDAGNSDAQPDDAQQQRASLCRSRADVQRTNRADRTGD